VTDVGLWASWRAGLSAATDRLAVVATADPGLDVPTCPGWTVARVTTHTGRIHRWLAAALVGPDVDRGGAVPAAERPPVGTDLGAWLHEGHQLLLAAIDATGPDGAVRAPGWERPATWWLRRVCHETTVHAWDAQAAAGDPDPVPVPMAIDGIDEVVDVFLPTAVDLATFGPDATLHLHTTDPRSPRDAGEWLIALGPGGVHAERRHAKGDVALRGPASDLLLWLWGRVPTASLDTVGDVSVAGRYLTATRY